MAPGILAQINKRIKRVWQRLHPFIIAAHYWHAIFNDTTNHKTYIMQQEFHFEHGDMTGAISVTLANDLTLDDFCAQHIMDYNRDRFEAFALRIFLGKETVITVYATDKLREEDSNLDTAKVAVKKFKINTLPVNELFSYCGGLNCTLTTGNYDLEDMEVMNR
jgi:hypothetical protein